MNDWKDILKAPSLTDEEEKEIADLMRFRNMTREEAERKVRRDAGKLDAKTPVGRFVKSSCGTEKMHGSCGCDECREKSNKSYCPHCDGNAPKSECICGKMEKELFGNQKVIAAKAPPKDEITGADFKALRGEKRKLMKY